MDILDWVLAKLPDAPAAPAAPPTGRTGLALLARIAGIVIGEDDGAPFPHCDPKILHAPGTCAGCDLFPHYQELRRVWNMNFTGQRQPARTPCPAEQMRGLDVIERWGGNRAVKGT